MKRALPYLSLVTLVVTLYVNFLAATSGINGIQTGAVSDKYPTLFTPAGYVFSIWSFIYLGLIGFTYFQFGKKKYLDKVRPLFIATNILNAVWMIFWHFDQLLLTVVMMLSLLIFLIKLNNKIESVTLKFSIKEKLLVKYPFQLYLGWISVATIANISVYLYSISWNGFGVEEKIWAAIMMGAAAVLALIRQLKNKDFIFTGVVMWALWGIGIKQIDTPLLMSLGRWLVVMLLLVGGINLFIYKEVHKLIKSF